MPQSLEVGQLGAFVRELLACNPPWWWSKQRGRLLAVTALLAVASTLAQTKLLVAGEAIKPKFSRISPLQGFKRLFSMRSIIEALKGMLKITVLLVILYQFLQDLVFQLPQYMYADVDWACSSLFEKAFSMVIRIVIAFTALAAFDFFYQWWDYERQLRMSKQEIKEEYKQMEGDPQIKSKIREVQRRMAQSRMMQQVPKADVVIRNPTHFAVALRYKPERDNAPVVVAKGVDELAQRIAQSGRRKPGGCGGKCAPGPVPLCRCGAQPRDPLGILRPCGRSVGLYLPAEPKKRRSPRTQATPRRRTGETMKTNFQQRHNITSGAW